MIKLKKFDTYSTNEIFQSLDIKFSFVNSKYEQVSNPIKCRDFLGDCIWSRKFNKEAKIYGFKYKFSDKPYDTKVTRLSLKFPNKQSLSFFKKNFNELTQLEIKYKIKPSKYIETDDKQTLVIVGSSVWQSAPWKLALYTFYLKFISYKSKEDLDSPEDSYYDTLLGNEDKLLSQIKKRKIIWYDSIDYHHNYSGFVSVIKGKSNMSKELGFK